RGLALVGSVEVLHVVDEDLDPGLHGLRGVLVALDVAHDGRDVRAPADRPDLVALRDRARDDPGEVAGLGLVEDESLVVRGDVALALLVAGVLRDADELVDAEELDARVGLRRGERVGPDEEADRHDNVVLLIDEALDVLLVVRDVLGDNVLGRAADGARTILNAFPRELVERLVLELADVGDHPNLQPAATPQPTAAATCDHEPKGETEREETLHVSCPTSPHLRRVHLETSEAHDAADSRSAQNAPQNV